MKKFFVRALVVASLGLAGCEPEAPTKKEEQAQKAAEAANSINFSENSEIINITRRLKLTANPGQQGFVLLLNEMGQPIMYTSVKGKITSGSKRLTRPQEIVYDQYGNFTSDSPSDEGTYGSSNEYIFFWTENGQYVQWNGKYLYSDKPFRIQQTPLVVNVR